MMNSNLLKIDDRLAFVCDDFNPLYVDFNASNIKKRHQEGKKQGLVRACKPSKGMRIIDATAGWGRDAAILASFGAEVLMLERHPIMAALLKDGLNRLQPTSRLKLSLIEINAIDYLKTLLSHQYPDVIYIDPMHPERQKSAKVKKDMQCLQSLVKPDLDVESLIQQATHCVKDRVVVKWPAHTKPLLSPQFSIDGKTVRFDVYISSR